MSSIMVIVVLVIFFLTLLFKLGPVYMNFLTLKSIMGTVAESPEPIAGGKPAILKLVESRMMINNVRGFDMKGFNVKKTGEDTFDLTLDYEQREHLFFNVDAVLSFKHAVVVKGR